MADVLDAEEGAGLVYIERSKTDQAGEGAYVMVTPDTLVALKLLRQDSETWSDDDPVSGCRCPREAVVSTVWRGPQARARDTRVTPAAWARPSE